MKKKLVETKDTCIYVPGETEQYKLHTDAVDETKVVAKTKKRRYSKDKVLSLNESSSTSIEDRLRSNRSKPKEDEDVKPTFPPPIDLTVNQDARAIAPFSFVELRNKKYFVDKTNLIREIYTDELTAKFYYFPRAGTKSTIVDTLIEWLVNNDKRRAERLECFKGLKIMDFAKDAEGNVLDGAIGFNQHIIIGADFGCVETDDLTFDEIKTEVTKEFCHFARRLYSLSKEAETQIMNLEASDARFFDEIVDCVKAGSSQTVNQPVLLIIDNFDAPALRLLNRSKSTELALRVMSFFNRMLNDVGRVGGKLFHKVILFGTHQPIGLKTKSNLKKIPVESYLYGRKELCSNFFFSTEEVKALLRNYGEDETKVMELAQICGQYNIGGEKYFYPSCIVNYVTRQKTEEDDDDDGNPVYWSSLDSLDVLADTSSMLRYEMILWTYQKDQILNFKHQKVLIYDNLLRGNNDTAFTYLLEAGYLTRKRDTGSNARVYQIVNSEAQNLFTIRYKQWCERIPLEPDHQPFRYFAAQDYKEFFAMANNILKTKYAGEDFQYEGQYHVYLSSFFHNVSNWHFKSNYQAGYGEYDFVTWSLDPLVSTGYLFEIAIVKSEHDPMKHIRNKIIEKQKQVQDKEYFVEVKKEKVKCIVVVGCRKVLSYSIFDVK